MVSNKAGIFLNALVLNISGKYPHLRNPIGITIGCKNMASTTLTTKRIAVCQMTATNNKIENLKTCSRLIKSAKEQGCKMVFLPEACDYIGTSREETLSLAEPLDGNTMKAYCNVAKEYGIWLSVGGFHEKVGNEKIHNSHVLVNSNGEVVAVYQKAHLFDVHIPEEDLRLVESDYVIPGREIVPPVETPVGNVAMSVCYDMRFPEMSIALAKMNAHILTYPSAFTYVTGAAHWETILRARAIECQCYVVAAAQTGSHNEKRTSWGHAMVVDPWGTVIAQCTEGTGIATAEINLDYIHNIKRSMPVWNHRRYEIYPASETKEVHEEERQYSFCNKIVDKDSIIYKSEHSLVFMSCIPIVPGHVLVIPLQPAQRLSDLNSEARTDLFLVVQKVQTAFEKCYNTSSNTVYSKEGNSHLLIHVLPRRPGDFTENDEIYSHLEKHVETVNSSENLIDIVNEAKMLNTCFKFL